MKRTSSMVYTPSHESRELLLYCENTAQLYPRLQAIINALKKKAQKNQYDSNKAVDAYYNITTTASDMYYRAFGGKFTVQQRFTAAVDLERNLREQVFGQ